VRRLLRAGEDDASFGDQHVVLDVDVADAVHALKREQYFALRRDLATDQTGVAALRHDGCSGLIADGEDAGALGRFSRPQQERRLPAPAPAPFGEMRRDLGRVVAPATRT